jgi:adenine/guanine phosphoribosyltransferase-like PRPP-binding protein
MHPVALQVPKHNRSASKHFLFISGIKSKGLFLSCLLTVHCGAPFIPHILFPTLVQVELKSEDVHNKGIKICATFFLEVS